MTKKQNSLVPAQGREDLVKDKDYQNLVSELKSLLSKGLYQAYKAVDNTRVQTYWQLGERVVREELKYKDRAEYGQYLIENLAIDLSVERRDLYRIVQFYRFYEIVSALSTQLSWGHFLELIVVEDTHRRAFYQNKAVFHSWSVRELRKQIKANLYGNTPPKDIEAAFQTKLPAVEPSKVFKNTYDFNFIELSHNEGEKDLENLIMKHFEHFLKEMGEDFAIIGRQVPLKIDGETHFIDIVLYNRAIPCVVAYNLFVLFKISALSNDWRHAQVHSLRWRLYNEAGKVVRHGRRLILKVSAWIHEMLADIRIRSKELACSYC